ncbi:uncharacterized mitochondrial protein AtMg00810-like [Juglans microcarpa x Juglans regia]|uniref:uncharacterized mitochondrial protein AtMg00810-like n=1 Tax=Juglans microcarpa x Juglans regia TaxID=2249226 RepID=UPI001B7EFBC4|nr:uncharacterized mitochondrial protein AtMg00810-like [Juglans microcarpa x Juglans regia]
MVLALVVSFNWDIRQLDVSNAFLHGILEEEVYMTQPKDFEDPVHPQFVLYVDDILVTSNDWDFITSLISNVQMEFAMKDLGQLTPYRAPCVSGSKLSKFAREPLPDPSEYRQTIGALQYVTLTHPDIAYLVNQLCQHMQNPTSAHWTAAKLVLRYLKNTLDHGLFYKPGSFSINAYCDFDWAGDPEDKRSTCGYGVYVGSNLISWSAKKQHVVSKSSTEAKYHCLALVTVEVYWLRMLLCELKVSLESAPVVWCDNISVLALTSNPIFHARSKHIEVDEKVANRDIILQHVSTSLQSADFFTKGHIADHFCFLQDKLSVLDLPTSLQGNDKDKNHPVQTG